jgi:thiamine-phosphate diphosphorylase
MMLCLVTDRRRLGAALGLESGAWTEALQVQVVAAAEAGIDLVQVREPDLEAGALVSLVRALAGSIRHTSTRLLVNDRLDVALAAGAAGVHLKEQSFPVAAVRAATAPGFVVGRSVHDAAGAERSGNADYLIAGTVLPTVSKPSATGLGWAGLSRVVTAAAGRPVLASAGSTCHRFRSCQLVAQPVSPPSARSFPGRARGWLSLCRNGSSPCVWGLTRRIRFPNMSLCPLER